MNQPAQRPRVALITGITGQDGSYLAELLLEKGYTVHGVVRRASTFGTERIDHLYQDPHAPARRLILHYGDMTDGSSLTALIARIQPDEIYNLAAQSHVKVSFEMPEYTAQVDALGVLRLLEAVRSVAPKARIYQASTSELFGGQGRQAQNEDTPLRPRSPYAAAKLYAHWIVDNYRKAYSLFACNGILFNHESPRRGETFVTRKITRAAGRIREGLQDCLYLGNLDARRDWGYAPEYVEAMWLMLQQDVPRDFVIATGQTHSVRDFTTLAFEHVGLELVWKGEGPGEQGVCASTGRVLVAIDPNYYRPTEVDWLLGDASRAREALGWAPQVTFGELVGIMARHDHGLAIKERRHKELDA